LVTKSGGSGQADVSSWGSPIAEKISLDKAALRD
jgi:hypothetical protein